MQKRRDLKKTDLRGLRLVGKAHLEYVDLEGANLERAVLRGADLSGAILKDAVLIDADLGGTCIEGVDLLGADINRTNLRTTSEACDGGLAGTAKGGPNTRAAKGIDVNNIMLAINWECAGLSDEVRDQIRAVLRGTIPTEKCK